MQFAKLWPELVTHAEIYMDIIRRLLAQEIVNSRFSLEAASRFLESAKLKAELLEKEIFPRLDADADVLSFAGVIKQIIENLRSLERIIRAGKQDTLSIMDAKNFMANASGWLFGLEVASYMGGNAANENAPTRFLLLNVRDCLRAK